MLGETFLTIREFAMKDPHPASEVHRIVLEFLQGRTDAAVFGAHAVNAYVREPRNTVDVDIQSTRAPELAEEIKVHLNRELGIATRVRNVRQGLGYRVYQLRKEGNRHLVDVRPVDELLPVEWVGDIPIVVPVEIVTDKVIAARSRSDRAKANLDERDLIELLRAYPHLKTHHGPVHDRLTARGVPPEVFAAWEAIVDEPIDAHDEDDDFNY